MIPLYPSHWLIRLLRKQPSKPMTRLGTGAGRWRPGCSTTPGIARDVTDARNSAFIRSSCSHPSAATIPNKAREWSRPLSRADRESAIGISPTRRTLAKFGKENAAWRVQMDGHERVGDASEMPHEWWEVDS